MIANIDNRKIALVLFTGIGLVSLIIFLDNRVKKTQPKVATQPPIDESQVRQQFQKKISSLMATSPLFYLSDANYTKLSTSELAELKLSLESLAKYRGERDAMKYAYPTVQKAKFLISKAS